MRTEKGAAEKYGRVTETTQSQPELLYSSYTTQTASTSAISALANGSESETEDQVPSLCK